MSKTVSLSAAFEGAFANSFEKVHVAMPARIESYDSATQRCSVQPLIRRGFVDRTGERQTEALPVVMDVPVVFPGAGDYCLKFPIAAGDTVLLVVSQYSLSNWLAGGVGTGGGAGLIDPDDDRRNHLSDAIAVPGLRAEPFAGPAAKTIEFTEDGKINAGGSLALALKSDVDAIRTALHNHGHTYKGDGSGAPAETTTGNPSIPAMVGTTVLKGA